jgi:SAM-dependent methyltransferase
MQYAEEIKRVIERGELPTDELVDALLPDDLKAHADQHFAGSYAIKLAAAFLSESAQSKILDIGSGSGKFCQLGALLQPQSHFIGLEYRASLVNLAIEISARLSLNNVAFLHQNVIDLSFADFTGFFMFNPFLEHRNSAARMQDFSDLPANETTYFSHVYEQFAQCVPDTRIVTLYVSPSQIPDNFTCVDQKMGGMLRFYISH